MNTLQEMIDAAERASFEAWYATIEHEVPWYEGIQHAIAMNAWNARAALMPRCRGVTHPGCNYLAACGTVCNKCGQVA